MYKNLQKVAIFKIIQEKIRGETDRQIKFSSWTVETIISFIISTSVKGLENTFSSFPTTVE